MFKVSVIWQPLEPDTSEEEQTCRFEIADWLEKTNGEAVNQAVPAQKASEVTASA